MTDGTKKRLRGKGASRQQNSGSNRPAKNRKCRPKQLSVPKVSGVAHRKLEQSSKGAGKDQPAARKVKIAVGRSYRLRNGTAVKVINQREVPTTINGRAARYSYWVGYIDGSSQRLTWETDSRYSPVADGPLDIVARA